LGATLLKLSMCVLNINWQSFLLGEEPLQFLYEVVIRTIIMFGVLMICLRIMGRRAFMQGLFEVALIISLGSATGDAMFYSKVGLLPTLLVLIIIVLLYRFINYLISKNRQFEKLVEGKVFRIIDKGAFVYDILKKKKITIDEIFADLRTQNISHLGQIERAYLEPSGKISIFLYTDNEIKYGMPIFPEVTVCKSESLYPGKS
jgi:uncharacterized membrane protein YcaP (DUF421 family)